MQTTHHLSQFHWSTFSCLFSNPHLPFFSSSSWVFIILILPCITIHLYHEIMDLFRICNSPQGLIRHLLCKSKNTSNTNHIEQKNNPIAIASTNLAHHTRTASKPNQPNPTCNRYWLSQPKNQPSYAKSSSRLILPSLSTSFFFFSFCCSLFVLHPCINFPVSFIPHHFSVYAFPFVLVLQPHPPKPSKSNPNLGIFVPIRVSQ